MTIVHPRNPFLFIGAISVSLAALAAETSAQSRSTPGRQLSDAVAEVLRSPFHGDQAPPGLSGHGLLRPVVTSPFAVAHVGLVVSFAPSSPGAQVPAAGEAPSRGRMFLLTTIAAAVGYGGTVYLADRCNPIVTVHYQENSLAGTRGRGLCPDESVVFVTGYLATIAMTGGAATLAGSGFGRSLIGSALGFAGGALGVVLTAEGVERVAGENLFDLSPVAVVGVISLYHAAITTLVAG